MSVVPADTESATRHVSEATLDHQIPMSQPRSESQPTDPQPLPGTKEHVTPEGARCTLVAHLGAGDRS